MWALGALEGIKGMTHKIGFSISFHCVIGIKSSLGVERWGCKDNILEIVSFIIKERKGEEVISARPSRDLAVSV